MPTATISCRDCPKTAIVTYKTRKPQLCPKCSEKSRKKHLRDRVARFRENEDEQLKKTTKRHYPVKPKIVHIRKGEKGVTYCGAHQQVEELGRWLVENPKRVWRYCSKCERMLKQDVAGRLVE